MAVLSTRRRGDLADVITQERWSLGGEVVSTPGDPRRAAEFGGDHRFEGDDVLYTPEGE